MGDIFLLTCNGDNIWAQPYDQALSMMVLPATLWTPTDPHQAGHNWAIWSYRRRPNQFIRSPWKEVPGG